MIRRISCVLWGAVLFVALGGGATAEAALGGTAQQLNQEGASTPVTVAGLPTGVTGYTVTLPSTTVVTEWLKAGTVVALNWTGPMLPDFSVFLGSYFPVYRDALASRTGLLRNRPVLVRLPQLVVHGSGHRGAFSGSAYDPTRVSVQELANLGVAP